MCSLVASENLGNHVVATISLLPAPSQKTDYRPFSQAPLKDYELSRTLIILGGLWSFWALGDGSVPSASVTRLVKRSVDKADN